MGKNSKLLKNEGSHNQVQAGLPLETKNHLGQGQETLRDDGSEKRKDNEQLQAEKDQALRRGKKRQMDALTEALKCTAYYHHIYWPWFKRIIIPGKVEVPLTVTRFYHERNLAVDIGPQTEDLTRIKGEILKGQNIQYVHCKDSEAVAQLAKRGIS